MSVAIQSFETACHKPCPDMPCWGLDSKQKAKGLENLKKVRESLGEIIVEPMRVQWREMKALSEHEDTPELTRIRLEHEMKLLDNKAKRIKERWS